MTITNFLAVMKMQGWSKPDNYNGQGVKIMNAKKDLSILINGRPILIQQEIWISNFNSYKSTLCACDTLECTVDYIAHLHPNDLPPNGKNS